MESLLEITFALAGIRIEQPYPGNKLQVSPFECRHNGQLLPDGLWIRYTASLANHVDPIDQGNVNLVLAEHGDRVLQLLALLIIDPFDYVGYSARLDGTEVRVKSDPEPMTRNLYNLVPAFRRDFTSTEFGVTVSEDIWPVLEQLLETMVARPPADLSRLRLSLRWIEKANKEMVSMDRMIAYWVAFNSLYADKNKRFEQERITQYITKSLGVVSASDFVAANRPKLDELARIPVTLRNGREVAKELAAALTAPSPNQAEIVKMATLTVYAIRNHIFHGSWDLYALPARQNVQIAEELLGRLLRSLVAGHILGYPLPEKRYVTWNRLGLKL